MPPIDPHIPHIWGFFYPKILTNFTQLVRITLLFVPRFERLTMLDNFSLNIPTLIVLIFGVVEFIKSLGVSGNKLRVVSLAVGFSHPVVIKPPDGIKLEVENNKVTVLGINKQIVGKVAADIRNVRPPEPYKGKGIKYEDEVVRRKAGKAAKAVGGA